MKILHRNGHGLGEFGTRLYFQNG